MRDERSRAESVLSVEVRRAGSGLVVVRVLGEVDLLTAPRLAEALSRHSVPCIADLSGVDFFGAAGLEALAKAQRAGTVLHVVCGASVRRLLELTGMSADVRVHGSLAEAELALGFPPG
ncbi:STAS domain-containing protein [Amycolatopsis sp.]|uniref:STAS domain-containing protein n=1 Tax=Amycolatopsis sp. TaxID=37632 RepID=UPI002C456D11|nr:STAS domain-containing protein [Amycolatopsis sp.]HVV09893.1 STAS domain-containing protein [Amycolatopsis sp.]